MKETLLPNLVATEKDISSPVSRVVLGGNTLTLKELISVSGNDAPLFLTNDKKIVKRMQQSHEVMMSDITSGKPVYGSNTSYGGQAGRVLNKGQKEDRVNMAKKLSESLQFLDVGVGPAMPQRLVKMAMVVRINMLLSGVSGVRLSSLRILKDMINKNIIPVVGEYGGIAASGDLIHNQRVISAARGLPGSYVVNEFGKIEPSARSLKRHHIPPLQLDPKEGLGLVNGDNFSTALAVDVVYRLTQYLLLATVTGAMAIEVLKGSDRSFHPLLSAVRAHPGQRESASMYRYLLKGSKLARNELTGHTVLPLGVKVQDAYSLRCLAQFEGVMIETLHRAFETVSINANSVSDNPLWVPPEYAVAGEKPWQWVSGGNFLAMHMVNILDELRIITTQLIKRNDRHLARIIDVSDNNGLPPNLSDWNGSVTHCSFKGIQIQSGMLEVYSMVLSHPVRTLFGIHEERNQDITAHATTSGMLALKNLELLKYSLSSMLLALAQGVDLRRGADLLSPATRPMYAMIRKLSRKVTEDRPLHEDIEAVASRIDDGTLLNVVREEVFAGYTPS